MIDTTNLLDIVSGRRRGFWATTIRFGLSGLTPFYRLVVGWRNRRFQTGQLPTNAMAVPVISVGNLTTGGTGKTPMVIWVSRLIQSHSLRVAIISRGYGHENTNADGNDEALELEDRLPGVLHLQDPDRSNMARIAVADHGSQVLVLDDGFQHRKLKRDLDIVLIDAIQPFGFGRLLPRGLLREPISSLARADAIVLTRCDAIDQETTGLIRDRIEPYVSNAIWARSRTVAEQWIRFDGRVIPIAELGNRRVLAICGIGNPQGFEHTLKQIDVSLVRQMNFPDHHGYSEQDIESIGAIAGELDVDAIVCTQKDLVKLGIDQLGRFPLYALQIGIEFLEGEAELAGLIERVIES